MDVDVQGSLNPFRKFELEVRTAKDTEATR